MILCRDEHLLTVAHENRFANSGEKRMIDRGNETPILTVMDFDRRCSIRRRVDETVMYGNAEGCIDGRIAQ